MNGPIIDVRVVKRSQGEPDHPTNVIALDRRCHRRRDLPKENPRRLGVHVHVDTMGRAFAVFESGPFIQAVPLSLRLTSLEKKT